MPKESIALLNMVACVRRVKEQTRPITNMTCRARRRRGRIVQTQQTKHVHGQLGILDCVGVIVLGHPQTIVMVRIHSAQFAAKSVWLESCSGCRYQVLAEQQQQQQGIRAVWLSPLGLFVDGSMDVNLHKASFVLCLVDRPWTSTEESATLILPAAKRIPIPACMRAKVAASFGRAKLYHPQKATENYAYCMLSSGQAAYLETRKRVLLFVCQTMLRLFYLQLFPMIVMLELVFFLLLLL